MTSDLPSELIRRRLLRSIGTGVAMTVLGLSAYFGIRSAPLASGTPAPLRAAFEWNGKIWRTLFAPERISPEKPPPPTGKRARVNGSLGLVAPINLDRYRVRVESGEQRLSLTIAEIALLPRANTSTDFRCIEGWSEVLAYSGVKFTDFIEKFGVGKKPNGDYFRYVALETPDAGYYVSVDMDSMRHPQTMLAFEMNGAPLTAENGAPLRLIIPVKYGIKSLKRIGRIYFSDERPRDFWAEQGYDWYSGL